MRSAGPAAGVLAAGSVLKLVVGAAYSAGVTAQRARPSILRPA